MSLINLFILSYFGMMVHTETIGVCFFLTFNVILWMGGLLRKHATRTLKDVNQHQRNIHRCFSNILSSELYFLQIKMAEPKDTRPQKLTISFAEVHSHSGREIERFPIKLEILASLVILYGT